ncbi:hypothetical protein ACWDXT_35450, partial [Streptomyces sp. NPDC003236]
MPSDVANDSPTEGVGSDSSYPDRLNAEPAEAHGNVAVRTPVAMRASATSARGEPRVIILTTFDLDRYVYAALSAGASGFLLKDVTPEHLTAAVRTVRTGDALLAPAITRRLVQRFAQRGSDTAALHRDLASLTPRELEVLGLLASAVPVSGRWGSVVSTRGSPMTACPVERSRTWFQMPETRSRTAGIQSQPEAAR